MQDKTTPEQEYLNPVDAAIYINLSPNTLARWRCEKAHLPYCKIGGAVRYRKSDLDEYAGQHRISVGEA